uniref:Uncharacterized protein n=1 Tax=Rhizophora mucronata TaxID=61149 RepID=A0A2P2JJU7_RHIMU
MKASLAKKDWQRVFDIKAETRQTSVLVGTRKWPLDKQPNRTTMAWTWNSST